MSFFDPSHPLILSHKLILLALHYIFFQGMVDGGDNIVEASWSSVSGIIHQVHKCNSSPYNMDLLPIFNLLELQPKDLSIRIN